MAKSVEVPARPGIGDPPEAPTLQAFGFIGIIDDGICSAGVLQFLIPAIVDDVEGDRIDLYVNGRQAAGTIVDASTKNRPFILPVNVTPSFDFTGYASVFYIVTKTRTPDNSSASKPSAYPVYRTGHPGPFNNTSGLPPPTVKPAKYNQQNLLAGDSVTISVPTAQIKAVLANSLKPLKAGDMIVAHLDLLATTQDKLPAPYFYPATLPPRTLQAAELNAATLDFVLGPDGLQGIDGNNGYAYYSLLQDQYFEQQSSRVGATIDVVPPHS